MFSEEEIERRYPLWDALADLYLDTESELFVSNILRIAREGGFTCGEVEHILKWEVRPAFYTNYLSVAGKWEGWSKDWLINRIQNRPSLTSRLVLGENRFMPDAWPEIQAALSAN